MYDVLVERTAERDLKHIPKEYFNRITYDIKALSKNPRPHGCRKLSGSGRDWRIRVGDYRVIYEIDDRNRLLKIMRVRHRREVYR
ncbi:MAG: plasmid stabilization protein [Planctomycetes bacterium RBG_16_43_13]|nr:MAG: plasmid stabilization protein [Planctomycetes bacterium RBG_16_43_13]